ncbi:MAG: ammonia-forming cytochrome c nitrite reductase subunit c552 [Armatimonadota bacterium]
MTTPEASTQPSPPVWRGWIVFFAAMIVTFVLGLLVASIQERRQEAALLPQQITPIADLEPDNAVWGKNFPREYQSWLKTQEAGKAEVTDDGVYFDYLRHDPLLKTLFAGYPFSVEYNAPRGHMHALEDIRGTARRDPKRGGKLQPGTCMTCKSSNVPGLMNELGVENFYKAKFADIDKRVTHPIGCADCHDAKTMNLRISRPALREAYAAMGKDIDKASLQEMRTLVCAQCHVEYFFAKKKPTEAKGTYLTFPWKRGMTIENMQQYYNEDIKFTDWVHKVSKTPMVKMQHPDFEIYSTGVHAYRGVTCADCHMPYRTEGGVKFTDHQVRSPLEDVNNSCGVCHRWSESEVKTRVATIQKKHQELLNRAETALVAAHQEVGAAMQAGATDAQLTAARQLLRDAQMRWDFIAAGNGKGFHSPHESARILASAIDLAHQARLKVAKWQK